MKSVFKTYSILLIIVSFTKIFEILRNILVASFLGVNNSADIFMGIISIPDSLIVLVGLDSLKGVINSEFSSIDSLKDKERFKNLFDNIFSFISIIALIFSVIIVIARYEIVNILLPGFTEEKRILAANIALIVFPVFFFKTIIGLLHSILNAVKRFYYPVLLNSLPSIFLIASIFLPYYNNYLIYNLSISVILSHIVVLILSYLIITKIIGIVKLKRIVFDEFTVKILKGCTALMMLLLSEQIFVLSKNHFASYYGEGAISSLNYSKSVSSVIMGLIFASVFSVLVSNLSTMFANNSKDDSRKLFTHTMIGLLYVIIFLVVIFLIAGKEILSLLYLRGNFTNDALLMTMRPYLWEVLSLISFILYIIPTSLYLSTKKYMKLNIIGSSVYISGIFINFIAVKIWGYWGISVANFMVTSLYGIILIINSISIFGHFYEELKIFIKLIISGTLTYLIVQLIIQFIPKYESDLMISYILHILYISSLSGIFYFIITKILKANYLSDFISIIKRK